MNTLSNFKRTVKSVLSIEIGFSCFKSLFAGHLRSRLIFLLFFISSAFSSEALISDTTPVFVDSDTLYKDSVTDERQLADTCLDSFHLQNTDSLLSDTARFDTLFTPDTVSIDSGEQKTITPKSYTKWARKRKIEKKEELLYPGISKDQDKLAQQVIHDVYSFDWAEAEKTARKMQKLEQRNNLPPLSYLLMVSLRVVRIQNSEFESEREGEQILEETIRLAQQGMALALPSNAPKRSKATYLFIYSGIEGFSATLKIAKNPVEAAIEGFNALKLLEKLIKMDPQIKDVYLGLGIFYCALAKAPPIVRGALNIVGRNVSFEKGIEYLRISAHGGKYTNETAKQYLIQFLSPYMGHEVIEKRTIFRSLQQEYSKNPYYLFLEVNEDICFHPEKINNEYSQRVKKRISKFKVEEYSLKRYAILLLYQYAYLDSHNILKPDTSIELREFSFYPHFLTALKERGNQEIKRRERYRRMNWTKNGVKAARMLDESMMSLNRKNFFAWYVRDALRKKM